MYRWFDARLHIRVHSIVCTCACLYILQQLQLWFCSCMCAETGPVFSTLYFSFTINIDLSMFELDFLAQYAIRRFRCQHLQQFEFTLTNYGTGCGQHQTVCQFVYGIFVAAIAPAPLATYQGRLRW